MYSLSTKEEELKCYNSQCNKVIGFLWLRWAIPNGKKTTWRNLSQGGNFWESASNSYYDLVNYLSFVGEEGKTIPYQISNVFFVHQEKGSEVL